MVEERYGLPTPKNMLYFGLILFIFIILPLTGIILSSKYSILDSIVTLQFPEWHQQYQPGNYRITGTISEISHQNILIYDASNSFVLVNISANKDKFFYKTCKHKINDVITYAIEVQTYPDLVFYLKRELC